MLRRPDRAVIGQAQAKCALAVVSWKQQLRSRGEPLPNSALLLYSPPSAARRSWCGSEAGRSALHHRRYHHPDRDCLSGARCQRHHHRSGGKFYSENIRYGVVFLDKILVRDNKRVESVRFFPGYCGVGGSNTSGFSTDWDSAYEYTSEELDGRSPLWIHGEEVCALVNDVLYCRSEEENGKKRVYTKNFIQKEITMSGDSIAYDTVSATRVSLILK